MSREAAGGDMCVLGHHGDEIRHELRGDQVRFRQPNRCGPAATVGFSCQLPPLRGLDEAGPAFHFIQTRGSHRQQVNALSPERFSLENRHLHSCVIARAAARLLGSARSP